MDIFKLVGSIYIDNDKANDSLAKTDQKASSVGTTLGSVGKAAGAMAVGVTTATAAAVTGVVAFASSSAEALDTVQKGAQQLGISYEAYQQLSYACERSGTSIDNLSKGVKNITNVMAGMGTSSATAAIESLGVATTDTEGKMRSSEDVLKDTIKSLADMEDVVTRDALANDLFGNSYQDLAPLLNSGADGIDELLNKASELGLVMSDDMVDAGATFQDTMDDLKDSFGALGVSLGAEFMPIVQEVVQSIIDWMPNVKAVLDEIIPVVMELFSGIIPALSNIGSQLLPAVMDLITALIPLVTDIISTILPVLINLIVTLIPPIIQIIEAVLPPLIEVIDAILPLFQTVIDLLMPIIQLFIDLAVPIIDLAVNAITPLIKTIVELMDEVLTPLMPLITQVAEVFQAVLQPVIEAITPIISFLGGIIKDVLGSAFEFIGEQIQFVVGLFSGLIEFITGVFTGNWRKAFEGLSKIVSNIFGALVNIVKQPINTIITGINSFIKGLNKVKVPDWVPGVGGKGINIPTIPKLAKGGTIAGEGLSIVGEAGAELIDMPQGARVTPLTQNQKDIFDNADILKKMEDMMAVMQHMADDIADRIGSLPAVIDGDEAFNYTVNKNKAYKSMTGKSAFI